MLCFAQLFVQLRVREMERGESVQGGITKRGARKGALLPIFHGACMRPSRALQLLLCNDMQRGCPRLCLRAAGHALVCVEHLCSGSNRSTINIRG